MSPFLVFVNPNLVFLLYHRTCMYRLLNACVSFYDVRIHMFYSPNTPILLLRAGDFEVETLSSLSVTSCVVYKFSFLYVLYSPFLNFTFISTIELYHFLFLLKKIIGFIYSIQITKPLAPPYI